MNIVSLEKFRKKVYQEKRSEMEGDLFSELFDTLGSYFKNWAKPLRKRKGVDDNGAQIDIRWPTTPEVYDYPFIVIKYWPNGRPPKKLPKRVRLQPETP